MDFTPSKKTESFRQRLLAFMAEQIEPNEAQYQKENRRLNPGDDWRQWQVPPLVTELKAKPKRLVYGIYSYRMTSLVRV